MGTCKKLLSSKIIHINRKQFYPKYIVPTREHPKNSFEKYPNLFNKNLIDIIAHIYYNCLAT
jgi:hypothetical protein